MSMSHIACRWFSLSVRGKLRESFQRNELIRADKRNLQKKNIKSEQDTLFSEAESVSVKI